MHSQNVQPACKISLNVNQCLKRKFVFISLQSLKAYTAGLSANTGLSILFLIIVCECTQSISTGYFSALYMKVVWIYFSTLTGPRDPQWSAKATHTIDVGHRALETTQVVVGK